MESNNTEKVSLNGDQTVENEETENGLSDQQKNHDAPAAGTAPAETEVDFLAFKDDPEVEEKEPTAENEEKKPASENDDETAVESEIKDTSMIDTSSQPEEKPTAIKSNDASKSFERGSLVLAQVKGYPFWPGLVLDNSDVPDHVKSQQPKKQKNWPVVFFGYSPLYWYFAVDPGRDIKALTPDVAQKWLKVPSNLKRAKTKDGKMLVSAYQFASEGPTLESVLGMVKGSSKDIDEPVEEEEDVEVADEDDDEENYEDDGDSDEVSRKRKTSSKVSNKKAPKKTKAAVVAKEPKKEPIRKKPSGPSRRTPTAEEREKEVLFLRHRLQKSLLMNETPNEDQMPYIDEIMKKVETYETLERTILTNTKISKALARIARLPAFPLDSKYRIRSRAAGVLQKWGFGKIEESSSPTKDSNMAKLDSNVSAEPGTSVPNEERVGS